MSNILSMIAAAADGVSNVPDLADTGSVLADVGTVLADTASTADAVTIGGMSTGAKVGIAVAATVAIGGAGYGIYRWCRGEKPESAAPAVAPEAPAAA